MRGRRDVQLRRIPGLRSRLERARAAAVDELKDRRSILGIVAHVNGEVIARVVVAERVTDRVGVRLGFRFGARVGEAESREVLDAALVAGLLEEQAERGLVVGVDLDVPCIGSGGVHRMAVVIIGAGAERPVLEGVRIDLELIVQVEVALPVGARGEEVRALVLVELGEVFELRDDGIADVRLRVEVGRLEAVGAHAEGFRELDVTSFHLQSIRLCEDEVQRRAQEDVGILTHEIGIRGGREPLGGRGADLHGSFLGRFDAHLETRFAEHRRLRPAHDAEALEDLDAKVELGLDAAADSLESDVRERVADLCAAFEIAERLITRRVAQDQQRDFFGGCRDERAGARPISRNDRPYRLRDGLLVGNLHDGRQRFLIRPVNPQSILSAGGDVRRVGEGLISHLPIHDLQCNRRVGFINDLIIDRDTTGIDGAEAVRSVVFAHANQKRDRRGALFEHRHRGQRPPVDVQVRAGSCRKSFDINEQRGPVGEVELEVALGQIDLGCAHVLEVAEHVGLVDARRRRYVRHADEVGHRRKLDVVAAIDGDRLTEALVLREDLDVRGADRERAPAADAPAECPLRRVQEVDAGRITFDVHLDSRRAEGVILESCFDDTRADFSRNREASSVVGRAAHIAIDEDLDAFGEAGKSVVAHRSAEREGGCVGERDLVLNRIFGAERDRLVRGFEGSRAALGLYLEGRRIAVLDVGDGKVAFQIGDCTDGYRRRFGGGVGAVFNDTVAPVRRQIHHGTISQNVKGPACGQAFHITRQRARHEIVDVLLAARHGPDPQLIDLPFEVASSDGLLILVVHVYVGRR